jgi:surface antigen
VISLASWPPLGWADCKTSTALPSLRGLRVLASLVALTAGGLSAGGCSFSYQLGSMFGKHDEKVAAVETDRRSETTATVATTPLPTSAKPDDGAAISDADVAAASAAAADMLASAASATKDASAAWENTETGARGMVTALAAAYPRDGFSCRDFLASIVRENSEAWLQGEACRVHHGKWVVRSMKPWKRA